MPQASEPIPSRPAPRQPIPEKSLAAAAQQLSNFRINGMSPFGFIADIDQPEILLDSIHGLCTVLETAFDDVDRIVGEGRANEPCNLNELRLGFFAQSIKAVTTLTALAKFSLNAYEEGRAS